MTVEIRALLSNDESSGFRSGDEELDLFFHRYAGQNQFRHHIGVTYVAVEAERIHAFVTVSPARLDADDLPSGRKRPPYPLPVLRIARLAVGVDSRGRGLGRALLRSCIEIAERMRNDLGCVGLLVDAKPSAITFYERLGFVAVDSLEGASRILPPPQAMFLPLGAGPRPRDQ